MKISDNIKYSWIKTIRDKKNIYFIIILTICSILMIGAISFSKAFFTALEESKDFDVSSRSLLIMPGVKSSRNLINEKKDEIAKMDHVLEIVSSRGFVVGHAEEFKSNIHSGGIEFIYGSENTLPDEIIGEKFTSEDTGVAICPINFYPGSMIEYPKGQKNIFLNGYDLLNKTFEISNDVYDVVDKKVVQVGKYNKKFKIIGLYDAYKYGQFPFNCYISGKDIEEIYSNTTDSLISDEGIAATDPSSQIVVDKYENTKEVRNKLINMGFDVNYIVEQNIEYQNSIKYTCLIVVFIVTICILFLTIFYVKKKNINNSYELGILKSMGYFNKNIVVSNTIQILILSLFSYILGAILFLVGINLANLILKDYLLFTGYGFYLDQYIITYMLALLIILIIPVVTTIIYTHKKIKETTMYIIKGDNV